MTHRDNAKNTLRNYFKIVFDASGISWDSDNDADMDRIVDELLLAVGESNRRTMREWMLFFDNPEYAGVNGKPLGILADAVGMDSVWIEGSNVPESALDFLLRRHEFTGKYFITMIGHDGEYSFYAVWRWSVLG